MHVDSVNRSQERSSYFLILAGSLFALQKIAFVGNRTKFASLKSSGVPIDVQKMRPSTISAFYGWVVRFPVASSHTVSRRLNTVKSGKYIRT